MINLSKEDTKFLSKKNILVSTLTETLMEKKKRLEELKR